MAQTKSVKLKKTKSIFFKFALLMLPIVLALDVLVLSLSYSITYNNNLKLCEKQIRNAAEMTVRYCENFNLYDNKESQIIREEYDTICNMFDITYVYVLDPDIKTKDETYLAIGFGDGASEDAKTERYPGYTVRGMLNEYEIEAYNGNTDGVILHEKNQFDDSLVCYMPCTRYLDTQTLDYKAYDHPVIVGAELSLNSIVNSFQRQFRQIALLTVTLTTLIVVAFAVMLYFKVSKPMRRISNRMSHFITYREEGFKKLDIKGEDEFAQMAQAFDTMADEINQYIDDIDALTRDKHTQEAELNIARNIQRGLLRPDHVDNGSVTINAYMLPAKDVGGDLYDYQLMDDGRVFVTVADVSGKGISAALFMSRAITLLHQYMLTEASPAKILAEYNDILAAQNPGGLFITTFLAVWDPRACELTYSNAGHNFPYILSDSLKVLKDAHGVAAGLFGGEEYEDATVPFGKGDTLFLYTDGVNEAKDSHGAFYSTERLEAGLSEYSKTDPSDTLNEVLSDLNAFTQGANQNDDITMLTLRVEPKPGEVILNLSSELAQLNRIKEAVFALDVSDDMKKSLQLAAEEIFVNICSYAYDTPGEVELKISPSDSGVGMTFTDGGKKFDPTADIIDIDEYDHDNAIGGLGRFLTFSIAERYSYEYRDGKNILDLFFREVKTDDSNKNT